MERREIKRKQIKIFIVIGIVFLLLFLVPITCQAAGALEDLGDLGGYGKIQGDYDVFAGKVSIFLGFFQIIGSVLSVICLVVLGIKYMMGTVEEKAAYKKTLMPYLLGAFMVLGVSNLLKVVYDIAIDIF